MKFERESKCSYVKGRKKTIVGIFLLLQNETPKDTKIQKVTYRPRRGPRMEDF